MREMEKENGIVQPSNEPDNQECKAWADYNTELHIVLWIVKEWLFLCSVSDSVCNHFYFYMDVKQWSYSIYFSANNFCIGGTRYIGIMWEFHWLH